MSLMDQKVKLLSDPNFRAKTEDDIMKEQEAELIAEVSAKYSADMSDLGSWRQMLRALCPVDVGAQQAEAIGVTVAVVTASTLLYVCCVRGGEEEEAEKTEEVSWSGDEDEASLNNLVAFWFMFGETACDYRMTRATPCRWWGKRCWWSRCSRRRRQGDQHD